MIERALGKIVVASILDTVEDTYYRIKARVETGRETGREFIVAYAGDPNSLDGGRILTRLTGFRRNKTSLDVDHYPFAGCFITSEIPENFEVADSGDVILYCIWYKERMGMGFDVPTVGRIRGFYDAGLAHRILYFSLEDGIMVPYRIRPERPPHLDNKRYKKDKLSPTGKILMAHVDDMTSDQNKDTPIVVCIDENIDFETRILPEFRKTRMRFIRMEPQK